MKSRRKEFNWRPLLSLLASLVFALVIGGIFMLASGHNPLYVYVLMFKGGFVGASNIMNSLQRATPLIFTSLAVLIGFRTGTFNMGVEGQLLLGAVAAAWAGFTFKGLPAWIHLPLSILTAMAAGALWALVPAVLKFKCRVNEIITTIMGNSIATFFTAYLANYPLRENPMAAKTPRVLTTARLPRLVTYSQVNWGLFIAVFCALLFWYLFRRTTFGYRMRMVGDNALFAEYVGINPTRVAFGGMLLSGALAGLAGGVEVLGVHYRFFDPFVVGLGFNGILIGWLGKGSPIGALLAALFYGGMQNGSLMVDMTTDVPRQLSDTVLAIVVFFMAAEGLFDFFKALRRRSKTLKTTKGEVTTSA